VSGRRVEPFRVTPHGPLLVLPGTPRDDERTEPQDVPGDPRASGEVIEAT
jgi:hypothetical protein